MTSQPPRKSYAEALGLKKSQLAPVPKVPATKTKQSETPKDATPTSAPSGNVSSAVPENAIQIPSPAPALPQSHTSTPKPATPEPVIPLALPVTSPRADLEAATSVPRCCGAPATPSEVEIAVGIDEPDAGVCQDTDSGESKQLSYTQLETANRRLEVELDLLKQQNEQLTLALITARVQQEPDSENDKAHAESMDSGDNSTQKRLSELQGALESAETERKDNARVVDNLTEKLNTVTIERDVAQDRYNETKRKLAVCSADLKDIRSQYKHAIEHLSLVSQARDEAAAQQKVLMQALQATEASAKTLSAQVQQQIDDLVAALHTQKDALMNAVEHDKDQDPKVKQEEADIKLSHIEPLDLTHDFSTSEDGNSQVMNSEDAEHLKGEGGVAGAATSVTFPTDHITPDEPTPTVSTIDKYTMIEEATLDDSKSSSAASVPHTDVQAELRHDSDNSGSNSPEEPIRVARSPTPDEDANEAARAFQQDETIGSTALSARVTRISFAWVSMPEDPEDTYATGLTESGDFLGSRPSSSASSNIADRMYEADLLAQAEDGPSTGAASSKTMSPTGSRTSPAKSDSAHKRPASTSVSSSARSALSDRLRARSSPTATRIPQPSSMSPLTSANLAAMKAKTQPNNARAPRSPAEHVKTTSERRPSGGTGKRGKAANIRANQSLEQPNSTKTTPSNTTQKQEVPKSTVNTAPSRPITSLNWRSKAVLAPPSTKTTSGTTAEASASASATRPGLFERRRRSTLRNNAEDHQHLGQAGLGQDLLVTQSRQPPHEPLGLTELAPYPTDAATSTGAPVEKLSTDISESTLTQMLRREGRSWSDMYDDENQW
ncbi:uncharacterized protein B0I36DRAFT_362305 [Microdochium trichocladiopsis]|uniref:Uncharacterized protein n=1 Tax=Microdochium trichocladiopsis TaxID=1682393 RepID=A0A9P8YAM4_9PEZI|nr:uncharacterized protein B0I36DRAFT_362305 [Microdochium trichocladiopsis]KAH7033661.1 hypothetical protein B0I36DRAFT_362305 [Microdochium trichocladiopsis]